MLKLLTDEKRKEIKEEYLKRYSMIFIFMISISILLYGISLIPSYLLVNSEENILKEQVRVAKDPALNKDRDELKNTLRTLGQTIELLDTDEYQLSLLIDNITRNQIRGVNISSIVFESNSLSEDSTSEIILQGSSSNRQVLASFVSGLETVDLFQSVELPFSSFAKNEDVPFTITIVLRSLVEDNENINQS